MDEKVIQTSCGFCWAGCGMNIHVKDGKVVKVRVVPGHPTTDGFLCPKGLAAKEYLEAPDRLEHPLIKSKTGFQRISWNEALSIMAEKLCETREKYGPQALALYSGNPMTMEALYGFTQFMAAYGSPNVTGADNLCGIPRAVGQISVAGGRQDPDYNEQTRYMIMWGANPRDTIRPGWLTYYGKRDVISATKAQGAKLVVIDPRRTGLAEMADEWVQVNLGADLALALAMLNLIIEEELYDKEFVAEWTLGFTELKEHIKPYTPKWASGITGIAEERIKRLTREYATTKPALIYHGNGIDMHINDVQTVRAIETLIAITGNLNAPGGNVIFPEAKIPPLATPASGLPMFSKAKDLYPFFPRIPFTAFVDATLTAKPYPLKGLIVHKGNPVLDHANERRVREALEKLDFIAVCDVFMTATTEMADLILPGAADFEKDDFMRFKSAKGAFIALRSKVVEPRGEAKPCFDIEYDLAIKMELDGSFPWKNSEEWLEHSLKPSGITLEDLKRENIIYVTPPVDYRAYKETGFNTPSKKIEIYSKTFGEMGHDPLPIYREDWVEDRLVAGADEPGKYPLRGTSVKPYERVLTKLGNLPSIRKLYPEPLIRIHPDDAGPKGIKNGDTVVVTSPHGQIKVKAKVSDEYAPGTVGIDFGWGNPSDGGANVNILTDDRLRCPVSGSPVIRHFRCQVAKASA